MSSQTIARALSLAVILLMLAGGGTAVAATGITVNGVLIAGTEARPDVAVNIVEFREGTSDVVRLIVGTKRYGITIVSRDPIALFDVQLPIAAVPMRFAVAMDNGRTFSNCLVAGLTSEGSAGGHRLIYTLRCENVTP